MSQDPGGELRRRIREKKLAYWIKRSAPAKKRKRNIMTCSLCLSTVGTFERNAAGHLAHVNCPNAAACQAPATGGNP